MKNGFTSTVKLAFDKDLFLKTLNRHGRVGQVVATYEKHLHGRGKGKMGKKN